jgi:cobalt-zinc-cadmium efflux system outer membrane protein
LSFALAHACASAPVFIFGGKMKAHFVSRALIVRVAWLTFLSGLATTVLYAQQEIQSATPLSKLVEEAQRNNPDIQAARHGYRAAQQVPKSAGALPDTQLTVEQFAVGSPLPFAGYTNSNFAYIGLGASQEIPYPGKRGLRAEVAARQADSVKADAETVERGVLEQLKTAYFRLAYLQQTLAILERDDQLLGQVQQIAESRYRVGQGNQQEVLKAQLQHTKILHDISMHHRDVGQLEAQLKQLLNRSQTSADIITAPTAQRALAYSASELLEAARKQNPAIASREAMLKRDEAQVKLADKNFQPDFNVQYMYQNTDRKFRDYYMATFSMNLPNRGRRRAELAEAQEKQGQADQQLQAEIQKQLAVIQEQYVVAQTSTEQLKIYKEGLIPQSEATFRSALAAYQANRQDFETLLSSFLDVLKLDLEYQRELADHESALATLESLTGMTLQ